jgi:hypothetical protein
MGMEVLEGGELKRRMLESYARNPKGWSFTISPSPGLGFFDATVAGPDGAWMLKIDSLFKPSPIVIGSQAEALRRRPGGPFPFGYRDLPPELALRLMGENSEGPTGAARRSLLSVLKSEPVVPVRGGSYAEGPLVFTGPGSVSLSDKQRQVDAMLSSEMRRLLRLRYPAYG